MCNKHGKPGKDLKNLYTVDMKVDMHFLDFTIKNICKTFKHGRIFTEAWHSYGTSTKALTKVQTWKKSSVCIQKKSCFHINWQQPIAEIGNKPLVRIAKWVFADLSCRHYYSSWSCIPYKRHVNMKETPPWSFV